MYKYGNVKLIYRFIFLFNKDTLKNNILCNDEHTTPETANNSCLASMIAPIYFIIFVLMAQFVLVNVVVAVLMKHLDVKFH